jgi:high mobility group protein B1
VGDVSKRSSERWKKLTKEEKMIWEEKARADKERYNIEKEKYTGPWQVPFKRAKKNPDAPKRPMSAFLYYSQEKRSHVKENNPGMKNTEVSRILGKMWQDATDEERAPHIEREKVEREKYKASMASWRKKEEGRKAETEKLRKETSMTPQTTYNYDIPEPIPFSAASSPTHPINQQDYPFGQHEHFYQGYNYHPPPDYMPSYTNEQYSYRRASVPYSNDRPSSYYHTSERHNVKAHRDYGQQPIRVYQDYGRTHARSHNDYANEDLRTWPYEYNPESHPSTNRTNDNVIYGSSYYAAASDNYENPNISSTQSSSHLF